MQNDTCDMRICDGGHRTDAKEKVLDIEWIQLFANIRNVANKTRAQSVSSIPYPS